MQETWLTNPRSGAVVALGFDGSENNDWTALRAEDLETGLMFTPAYGDDELPAIWRPEEWGGEIPRAEVHAAVDEVFSRYEVARFYCDPQGWRSEIGEWSAKYGAEKVLEWPTNIVRRMYPALTRFLTDLGQGRMTHDGCPLTSTAASNARRKSQPGDKYILAKPTEQQKIDPLMAAVLAHEAAMDSKKAGYTAKTQQKTEVLVLGRRRRNGRNTWR